MMAGAHEGDITRVFKSWQAAVYPETRMDHIKYLKKATEVFKKYEKMDLRIINM